MTRQKLLALVACCFLLLNIVEAQDPIFSQYYSAPLQVNPAFAGNSYAPAFNLNYRNQWPELNAYQTYSASYDQYLDYINSGVGVAIVGDEAGDGILQNIKVSGIYSYRLRVTEDMFIKFGAEASVVQARLDWDKLLFLDQLDPENGSISPNGNPYPSAEVRPDDLTNVYLDMSAGMLAYSKYIYGGFSIKHLNTPNEAFIGAKENLNEGLPLRYSMHLGGEIPLFQNNNNIKRAFISPNLLWIRQADFGQLNVGSYAGLGMFHAGAWYRYSRTNSDAVILLVGIQKGLFKIGYSYDVTVSALNTEVAGAHEISLGIRLREPEQDINDCLHLFR
ncbi:MAG: type IX secretion system membrane protein PorP/SprF [Saprospiraceae bacterium]